MKKILLLLFANVAFAGAVYAQCSCAGTDYGTLNVAGWTVGQSANIATNIYAGERSLIQNTVAGATYRISTCGAGYDTELTIYTTACDYLGYNDDNGPACSTNRASIDIVSPGGNLYSKLNTYGFFGCGTNSTNTTVSVTLLSLPDYLTNWISMNTGSSDWCAGETRNVSVTVKNNGTETWTDGSGTSDFNIGIKWNADADYFVRVDAGNLLPGATQTYNFIVTAPTTPGSNNLSFDVVRESCFWFANNGAGCGSTAGPGNVVYTSPVINIKPTPTSVSAGADVIICPGESTNLNGTTASSSSSGSMSFDYSGSGDDCDNFRIGGITSGIPAGATITSIVFNATIGPNCTSWYEWDLMVNNVYITSGCNGAGFIYNGLNGSLANGQALQLRSWDNDFWCDFVTMTASFTVNYLLPPPLITYSWSPIIGLNNPYITNPIASPTSTTTYTMTATANGCSATDDVIVTIDNPTALATSVSATGTRAVNSTNWIQIVDNNCDLIAEINSNGLDLGDVTATLLGNGNASMSDVCGSGLGSYAGRIFRLQSTNTWSGNVSVRLYITPAELSSLINEAGCLDSNGCEDDDDVCGITDVNATKYPTGDGPGGPNGVYLNQTGNGTGYGGNYVEFSVTEFSDFYLHGSESGVTLPVELISFTAKAVNDDFIRLDFSTATEINNDGFEIHRSVDGENFEVIGWVEGNGNTTEVQTYSYKDTEVQSSVMYYYRLKQVDYDGVFEYSDVRSARIGDSKGLSNNWDFIIFPNPATGIVNIQVRGDVQIQSIRILDLAGKTLANTQSGDISLMIPVEDFGLGLYMIEIHTNQGVKTHRFVKK